MTHLAALSLAAFVAMGATSGAQAFDRGPFAAEQVGMPYATESGPMSFDHCHGRTSGTASPRCGTATGGPSGGLF